MNVYLDTSAVVALLVPEAHTPRVVAWLPTQPVGSLYVSDWSETEVASALSLRLRTGTITLDRRAAALSMWRELRSTSFQTLGIVP